jgi:UDP-glucose 4-epimerase
MMQRVLLVGKNSFIGSNFLAQEGPALSLDSISHEEIESVDLRKYDCVVNTAYQWSYFNAAYSEERDFTLQVARRVAAHGAHFVMMSSRKVYGTKTPFPTPETASLSPEDFYGRNNVTTESKVLELLGPRCTILRPANVFGFEPGRHTFFGLAISRLLQKKPLVFEFSGFTPRDFIPVEHFSRLLAAIVKSCPPGVFNVGAGVAVPVGQIALWIIEGYGQGEIQITKPHEFDRFWLDITKLEAVVGSQPDLTQTIRRASLLVGERMREIAPAGTYNVGASSLRHES